MGLTPLRMILTVVVMVLGKSLVILALYIKKPWRIVSWNVDIGEKLSLRCDGRHEHAPCAGRETVHTQIYTSKIVSIILDEQMQRCIGGSGSNSSVMHGLGSSGTKSKKCVVAASCVQQPINDNHSMTNTVLARSCILLQY